MRIVAFVTDLMDRSKLGRAGDVAFGRDPADAAGADVVIIDLGAHAGLVASARLAAPDARIVAYGRHTAVDALRQAVADGADDALPRSAFFADVVGSVLPGQTNGQG